MVILSIVFCIDDYCRMNYLYLMKERSEALSKFVTFFNEIRNQHSATIKIFSSDNALEYNTTTFKQFFDTHGIIHEGSCAHTIQQNGVAKRKHRHLLEITHSIMTHVCDQISLA